MTNNEKIIASLIHFSGAWLSFLPSLVLLIVKLNEEGYLKTQAKTAFNFQATIFLFYVLGNILMVVGIGYFVVPILWIVNTLFCIIAAINCYEGKDFRYPFGFKFMS